MANFILGIILVILGSLLIWSGRLTDSDFVLRTDVKKSFDNVDWSKQSFSYNNDQIKDSEGNRLFYRTKSIDEAIKKLNKIID